MKVIDYINQAPGNELIYIGAASSYFFIGTKTDFFEYKRAINDDMLRIAQHSLKCFIQERRRIQNGGLVIARGTPASNEAWVAACDYTYRRLQLLDLNIPKMKEYISNYKPIEEREILDTYKRFTEGNGTVLIVEGDEVGQLWFYHEFIERYSRDRSCALEDDGK